MKNLIVIDLLFFLTLKQPRTQGVCYTVSWFRPDSFYNVLYPIRSSDFGGVTSRNDHETIPSNPDSIRDPRVFVRFTSVERHIRRKSFMIIVMVLMNHIDGAYTSPSPFPSYNFLPFIKIQKDERVHSRYLYDRLTVGRRVSSHPAFSFSL